MIADLMNGFSIALSFENFTYCLLGVVLGTAIGVLPGVGSLATISMLMPITFYLEPTTAIIMLAGVYYGSEYGGSTASILLNLPGQPSNAVTCVDGYPMARQGRAGVALFIAAIGSFIGGSLGIILLMIATPAFVALAMMFGSKEYFVALVFGLVLAATISQGRPAKGLAMLTLGILIGSIGADVQTGTGRFTMGYFALYDGVNMVVLAMGLFGISEVIWAIRVYSTTAVEDRVSLRSMIPTRDDIKRSIGPILRGTGVGSLLGPLPGAGLAMAAFLSYAVEKRTSKTPERFGKGAIEGVAGPETANNAAAQTAFIPTFALGIPGTATMAIMLGALMMHGITPGPQFVRENFDMFWAIVASFWIGNILLLIVNIPFIGVWVRLLKIPYHLLYPAIICLVCIGVYSVHSNVFDIWLLVIFAVAGYVMRLLEFEPAPLLMGFVLGPLLEENFRRSMLLSGGEILPLFQGPVNTTLLGIFAVIVTWSTIMRLRRRGRSAAVVETA
jgi:putative tricarboxylic transport membrane protein